MEQLAYKFHTALILGDMKRSGDEYFLQKNYLGAYVCYRNYLKLEPSNSNISSKVAFSLFNLGAFKKALEQSDKFIPPLSSSCLTLKVKCFWALGKYQDALDFLRQQPLDSVVKQLVQKSQNIIKHSNGTIDTEELFSLKTDDFIGEFKSNSFELKEIPGKGRGLVATKPIKCGELIICSRAWEILYENDSLLPPHTRDDDDYYKLLSWKIFQKLQVLDEDCRTEFCELSVDKRTTKSQGWLGSQFVQGMDEAATVINVVNKDDDMLVEIKYRILNNGFKFGKIFGVWILPSYINHSCVDCNVLRQTYGNMMVIRAIRDIEKGDELTLAYVSPIHPDRQEILEQHNIQCDCRLCFVEKQDADDPTVSAEVENVLQSLAKLVKCSPRAYVELVKKIVKLREKCPINIQLIDERVGIVAVKLFANEDHKEAVEIFKLQAQVQRSAGMMREMVSTELHLMKMLLDMGDLKGGEHLATQLKKDIISVYGQLTLCPIKNHPMVKDLEDSGLSIINLLENPKLIRYMVVVVTG